MDERKDRAQTFSDRVNSFPAFVVLVVIVVAVMVVLSSGGDDDAAPVETNSVVTTRPSDPTPTTSSTLAGWTEDDIEWKLAAIDNGGDVALDDPTIDVFAIRLDRLEAVCLEDRTALGDMTTRVAEMVAEATDSPLWIANTMNGLIGFIEGVGAPEHDCIEDFARYISEQG
jgi:hypothetical protein